MAHGNTGNKNALGNEGGRPPIYDASNPEEVKKLDALCTEYFTYIQGEYKDILNEDGEVVDQKTIRHPEFPTVTGLTLFLGFCDKSTLYDYSKKVEFSHSIKRALTKIEQFHEIAAAQGDKCVGNIFILKNFGWKDTVATEHSGGIDFNLKDMVKFDNTKQ